MTRPASEYPAFAGGNLVDVIENLKALSLEDEPAEENEQLEVFIPCFFSVFSGSHGFFWSQDEAEVEEEFVEAEESGVPAEEVTAVAAEEELDEDWGDEEV